MSRSDDAGHFFQTSDSLATTERKTEKAKNKHGNPIKLSSKLLAVQASQSNDSIVYIAEAAGDVKRVNVETGEVKRVFDKGNAPLTCLALRSTNNTLFAGCWNKTIYTIQLGNSLFNKQLTGHTDFVKCLLTTSLNGKPILISGGADASIIIWNIQSGGQLHKLKGHVKALQDLAVDPLSIPEGAAEPGESLILFTSSSDREIRRWHVSLESASELRESIEEPILAHDTSVYRLRFDSEGDLWTASADKTAKHLVRNRGWEADTTLQHPDFVRDIGVAEDLGLVVTACRDEEVRVWDSASGDLVWTYSGHYEEVTGLLLLGSSIVSVSIDGTIRRWGLGRQDMVRYQEELKREAQEESSGAGPKKAEGILTADEEAELAELMEPDD